jgi:hypothetical protein
MLLKEKYFGLCWRIIDWQLIARTVCILNGSKFLISVYFDCAEFALITEWQEVVKEKLKLVSILFGRLDSLAFTFVPCINLFECLVIQLIQRIGILAEGEKLLCAKHEYQYASKIKVERVIAILPARLLLRKL